MISQACPSAIQQDIVTIRDLDLGDASAMYQWVSDPEVVQFTSWDLYCSKGQVLQYIQETVLPHPFFKAICFQGKVVGSLTITQGQGNSRCRAELGYVLSKAYWSKGIMTQAVALAVSEAFKLLDISRIEAFVDPINGRSQRVLEKVGLTKEGLLKNHVIIKGHLRDSFVYSITPSS